MNPDVNAADAGGINPQVMPDDNSAPQAQAPPPSPAAQSQPQPQAPAPKPQVTQPPAPGEVFKKLSHSFMGALLGGLAGKQPTKYIVDSTGKTVPDPAQPQQSTSDKLRSIATNALQGLAAGAQAGPQKSKAASLAAGLGAGAQAQQKNAQEKDAASKQSAGEDYERQQQKILRQHDVARANLLQYANTIHMLNDQQDRDPEIAKNKDIVKSFEDEGNQVDYISDDELQARQKADPAYLTTHHMFPLGTEPVMAKDEAGNLSPVMGPDGQPKMQGRIAAVDATTDPSGKYVPPASFIADAKKYAAIGGAGSNLDGLEAGQPLTMENFTKLHGAINAGKKAEHEGWQKPEDVFGGKDGKTPMQRNPITGEVRAYPAGVTPNIENKPVASAATVAEKGAATTKDIAEADRARAEAEKARTDSGNSKDDAADLAQQLVEHNADPSQLSKRSSNYNAVLKAANDYSKKTYGKPFDLAQASTDYKQANNAGVQATLKYLDSITPNMKQLVKLSDTIPRSEYPPLSAVEQWAEINKGNQELPGYYATLTEVSDQVAKILQGGGTGNGTSDAKLKAAQELFAKGFNPGQIRNVFTDLAPLLDNRKLAMIGNNPYLKRQFATPGQPADSPITSPPAAPKPDTHDISLGAAMKKHPGSTEAQIRDWAKQNNYTVTN